MFVKVSPNPTLTIGYFMNVKQSFLLKSKIFALLNYVLFRGKRKKKQINIPYTCIQILKHFYDNLGLIIYRSFNIYIHVFHTIFTYLFYISYSIFLIKPYENMNKYDKTGNH